MEIIFEIIPDDSPIPIKGKPSSKQAAFAILKTVVAFVVLVTAILVAFPPLTTPVDTIIWVTKSMIQVAMTEVYIWIHWTGVAVALIVLGLVLVVLMAVLVSNGRILRN